MGKKFTGPNSLRHLFDSFWGMERGNNDEVIITPIKARVGDTTIRSVFRRTPIGLVEIAEQETGLILRHRNSSHNSGFPYPSFTKEFTVDEVLISLDLVSERPKFTIVGGQSGSSTRIASIIRSLFPDCHIGYVASSAGLPKLDKDADLAIAVGLLALNYQKLIPKDIAFMGTLDGKGNILSVGELQRRTKRANELGYSRVIGPKAFGTMQATWEEATDIMDVWTNKLGFSV